MERLLELLLKDLEPELKAFFSPSTSDALRTSRVFFIMAFSYCYLLPLVPLLSQSILVSKFS